MGDVILSNSYSVLYKGIFEHRPCFPKASQVFLFPESIKNHNRKLKRIKINNK